MEHPFQTSAALSEHFKTFYFGGNWTAVNMQDTLGQVSFETAMKRIGDCNTIAILVYHIHYYVLAVTKVLEGGPLDAKDKYSFDLPEIKSEEEWKQFVEEVLAAGRHFAELVATVPDDQLGQPFAGGQYGTVYRNIAGLIEHSHYHLGQIVLLKKLGGA